MLERDDIAVPYEYIFTDEAVVNQRKTSQKGGNITGIRAVVNAHWQHDGKLPCVLLLVSMGSYINICNLGPITHPFLDKFKSILIIPQEEEPEQPIYVVVCDKSIHWGVLVLVCQQPMFCSTVPSNIFSISKSNRAILFSKAVSTV